MEIMTAAEPMVRVRALKPFVGSYRCGVAEATAIEDEFTENEQGEIVRRKVPRKRIVALVAERRALRQHEIEAGLKGKLPENIILDDPSALDDIKPKAEILPIITATIKPEREFVEVPASMADDLVARGLAEIVTGNARRRG